MKDEPCLQWTGTTDTVLHTNLIMITSGQNKYFGNMQALEKPQQFLYVKKTDVIKKHQT